MVVYVNFNHVYKYPCEIVTKAYFNKYTSGKDSNVQAITIEEQNYDAEKGVEYVKRKGQCNNVVPWIFRKILGESSIYFEERAEYCRKERSLRLHTRNLTWSNYVRLEETSQFRPSTENPDWTDFEQQGVIDAFGLGPLASLGERLAKAFLIRGGQKGITIMESLIKESYHHHKMDNNFAEYSFM